MIAPGSLVGFALAGVVTAWVASALLSAAVLAGRRRLRRLGPGAERTAATQALVLPLVLGGSVILALALQKILPLLAGGQDHCAAHPHHLHLCLVHGGSWARETWAVVALAGAGVLVAGAAVVRAGRLLAAGRVLRGVRRNSRALDAERRLYLSPSDLPFSFVAGLLRPSVYVASCIWERLDDAERAAMVAHERAHAERGDVWKRSVLDLFALLGAPFLAAQVRDLWLAATERLRDADAAAVLGDPAPVASALVRVARLQSAQPVGSAAFVSGPEALSDRVESVLASSGGGRAPRWMPAAGLALVAFVLTLSVGFSDPLHHLLESLLGSL